jgi:hypothetical protein
MGTGALAISLHRGSKALLGTAAATTQSPPRAVGARRLSSPDGALAGGANGSGGSYDTASPAPPVAAWEEQPQLGLGPGLGANPEQLKRRLQSVLQAVDAGQNRYEEVLLEANKAIDLVRSMESEIRWGSRRGGTAVPSGTAVYCMWLLLHRPKGPALTHMGRL